jgi:CRP-like cAMP-binding protein
MFLFDTPKVRDIPEDILQEIARRLQHVRYQKGQPIFLEHERSDRVYFITRADF